MKTNNANFAIAHLYMCFNKKNCAFCSDRILSMIIKDEHKKKITDALPQIHIRSLS